MKKVWIAFMGIFALAMMQTHCGKSTSVGENSGSSGSSASTVTMTGTLAIASTTLALAGEAEGLELATTGTIKCTYATETEDKADVGSDGKFTMSCKSGVPMVMSYFDTDGNPTCSILFKISSKETAAATITQDVDMKSIKCQDGAASVDLDTLAPNAASKTTFTQDASVSLFNGATDHWEFTIEHQAMIGADGKSGSGSSESSSKKVRKKASLAGNTGTNGPVNAQGSEVGTTVNMAFMDETCDGGAVADGIITVQHEEPNPNGGQGEWECIDGAKITWAGKSFSIKLTEDKDIATDMAKNEIQNQRPPQEEIEFQQVGTDGKVVEVKRDEEVFNLADDGLALAESFAAPDTISTGMNFPVEAYCASTKWKAFLDTATFGTPCTKMAAFQFVDFGKVCSNLTDTATASTLAKANVMQCSATGGSAPTASNANKNDPQCASDYKDFPNGSPVEHMSRGIGDLGARLALIVKLNDLAIAGDTNVVSAKAALADAVANLKTPFQKLKDKLTEMEAAVAQIKANRITRCTSSTQTSRNQSEEQALYAKMDGSKLQPLFNAFEQAYRKYVLNNPPVNNLFRVYITPPTNGFDGTACTIPDGAETHYNASFLKPTGTCKFITDITIAGVFKDASTIKPLQLTFMDKPNGECSLAIQHIAFDESTGCWQWDGTKPKLTSESVDKNGMFKGNLIDRMKLMGSAVKAED